MDDKINLEGLESEIPDTRVWGKLQNEDKNRWIELSELLNFEYYIVYSDDGGDTFIKFAENEEKFTELLQKVIVEGDTNCDFDTSISIVVKNGVKYTPIIS